MPNEENVKELPLQDGTYAEEILTPDMARTNETPIIENPDDREYEKMEEYKEGGI